MFPFASRRDETVLQDITTGPTSGAFTTNGLGRRQFLQATLATGAAVLAGPPLLRAADDPWKGLKIGLQSYTLREFSVTEAMEHTQKFGLSYWEAFPNHIPMTTVPKQIEEQKAALAKHGITLYSYGVLGFNTDETAARQKFDYAKAMGIKSLSADPDPTGPTFDLLDKLVAEYDIAIAIHNHGPGHRYDKIADVEKVVKGRHPKIGACVDTGHYLRSDESPVDAIERLDKRVFGVHLKDVKTITVGGERTKQFVIAGEGDLDVPALLQALHKRKYQYVVAVEYEENAKNPLNDLDVILKHVKDSLAKIR